MGWIIKVVGVIAYGVIVVIEDRYVILLCKVVECVIHLFFVIEILCDYMKYWCIYHYYLYSFGLGLRKIAIE